MRDSDPEAKGTRQQRQYRDIALRVLGRNDEEEIEVEVEVEDLGIMEENTEEKDSENKSQAFDVLRVRDIRHGRAIRKELHERFKALVRRVPLQQQKMVEWLYTDLVRKIDKNPKQFIEKIQELIEIPRQFGDVPEIEVLELVVLRLLTRDMRYNDIPSLLQKQGELLGILQKIITILPELKGLQERVREGKNENKTSGIRGDNPIGRQQGITERMLSLLQEKQTHLVTLHRERFSEERFYKEIGRLDGVFQGTQGYREAIKNALFTGSMFGVFLGTWNLIASLCNQEEKDPLAGHYGLAFQFALLPVVLVGAITSGYRDGSLSHRSRQHAEDKGLLDRLCKGEDIAGALLSSTKGRIHEVARQRNIAQADLENNPSASSGLLALTSNSARSDVPFALNLISNAATGGCLLGLYAGQPDFYKGGVGAGAIVAFFCYAWKELFENRPREVTPEFTYNTFLGYLKERGVITEQQLERQIVAELGSTDRNTWLERIQERLPVPQIDAASIPQSPQGQGSILNFMRSSVLR